MQCYIFFFFFRALFKYLISPQSAGVSRSKSTDGVSSAAGDGDDDEQEEEGDYDNAQEAAVAKE